MNPVSRARAEQTLCSIAKRSAFDRRMVGAPARAILSRCIARYAAKLVA
jgi:hypothetical protein